MNNPCKECIVSMMCSKGCEPLEDYIIGNFPSDNYRPKDHANMNFITNAFRSSTLNPQVEQVKIRLVPMSDDHYPLISMIVVNADIIYIGEDTHIQNLNYDRGKGHTYYDTGVNIVIVYRTPADVFGHYGKRW
jgi:hypothetical protein